jgi:hypothetical protein
VRAARVLARQRRRGDHARYGGQALQVQPVVPAHVVFADTAVDAGEVELFVELVEAAQRTLETLRVAQNPDVVPHAVEQALAHGFGVAGRRPERRLVHRDALLDRVHVGRAPLAVRLQPRGHRLAGDAAEHRRVGDAVAPQPIRPVHTARCLRRPRTSRAVPSCNRH